MGCWSLSLSLDKHRRGFLTNLRVMTLVIASKGLNKVTMRSEDVGDVGGYGASSRRPLVYVVVWLQKERNLWSNNRLLDGDVDWGCRG